MPTTPTRVALTPDPADDAPWTLERLGASMLALMQAVDALTQIADAHTKLLHKVLEAAAAPGESSQFSPLNRNLNLIAQLLRQNGQLLGVICQQVGGSLPAKP